MNYKFIKENLLGHFIEGEESQEIIRQKLKILLYQRSFGFAKGDVKNLREG